MSSVKTAYKLSVSFTIKSTGVQNIIAAAASRSFGGLDLQGLYINDSIDILDKWVDPTDSLDYLFSSAGDYTIDFYTNSGESVTYLKPGFLYNLFYTSGIQNFVTSFSMPAWDFSNVTEIGVDCFRHMFAFCDILSSVTMPTFDFSNVTKIGSGFFVAAVRGISTYVPYPNFTFGSLKTVGDKFLYLYNCDTVAGEMPSEITLPLWNFSTLESVGAYFLCDSLSSKFATIEFPLYDFSSLKTFGTYFMYQQRLNASTTLIYPAWNMSSVTLTTCPSYFLGVHGNRVSCTIKTPAPAVTPTKSWYNLFPAAPNWYMGNSTTKYTWTAPAALIAARTPANLQQLPYYTDNYVQGTFYASAAGNYEIIPTSAQRSYCGLQVVIVVNGTSTGVHDPATGLTTAFSAGFNQVYLFVQGDPASVVSTAGSPFIQLFNEKNGTCNGDLRALHWHLDFPNLTTLTTADAMYCDAIACHCPNLELVTFPESITVPDNAKNFFCNAFAVGDGTSEVDTALTTINFPKLIFKGDIGNNFFSAAVGGRLRFLKNIYFGDWDTTAVTSIGNYFFNNFYATTDTWIQTNYGKVEGNYRVLERATLPNCDFSNVVSIGNYFCYYAFGINASSATGWASNSIHGNLIDYPIPDWNFSNLESIGTYFMAYCLQANQPSTKDIPASQQGGDYYTLPSFTFTKLDYVGNYFFYCYNYCNYNRQKGKGVYPLWNLSTLTQVGNYFFGYVNYFSSAAEVVLPDYDFHALKTIGTYFFTYFAYRGASSVTIPAWDMTGAGEAGSSVGNYFFRYGIGGSSSSHTIEVKTPHKDFTGTPKSWFNVGGRYTRTAPLNVGCTKGAIWNTSPQLGAYDQCLTGLYYRPTTDYCITAMFTGLTSGTAFTMVPAYNLRSFPMGLAAVYIDATPYNWNDVKTAISYTPTSSYHTLRIYTNSGSDVTSLGCEDTPTVPLGMLFNVDDNKLNKLYLPKWDFSNVTKVQNFLYRLCAYQKGLSYVRIPDFEWTSMTNVGWVDTGTCCFYSELFSNCTNLQNIAIDWSGTVTLPVATKLPKQCFYQIFNACTSLTECHPLLLTAPKLISIPTNFGAYSYNGCTGITVLKFPMLDAPILEDTGTYMYQYCFAGCTGATSTSLVPFTSTKLKKIGSRFLCECFNHCTSLKSASLPMWDFSNVTTIGAAFLFHAFRYCTSLRDSEEQRDFYSPTTLKAWNFSKVTSIENSFMDCCFGDCSDLRHLNLPYWDFSSVTTLGDRFITYLCYNSPKVCCVTVPNYNFSNITTVTNNHLDHFSWNEDGAATCALSILVPPKKFTGQPEYYACSWHSGFNKFTALNQQTDAFKNTSYLMLPNDWPYYSDSNPAAWSETARQLGRGYQNLTGGYQCPHHPFVQAKYYFASDQDSTGSLSAVDTSSTSGGLTYLGCNADGMPWRTTYPSTSPTYSGKYSHKGWHILTDFFIARSGTFSTGHAFYLMYSQYNLPNRNTNRLTELYVFPTADDSPLGSVEYCPYTGNLTTIDGVFMGNMADSANYLEKVCMGKLFSNNGSSLTSIYQRFLQCAFAGARYANSGNKSLKTVHMPGIGKQAPWNFSRLTTISDSFMHGTFCATSCTPIIPNINFSGVQSIGADFLNFIYTFSNSTGEAYVPDFSFSDSLTSIGNSFMDCTFSTTKITACHWSRFHFDKVTSIGSSFLNATCNGCGSGNMRYWDMPLWNLSSTLTISTTNFMYCAYGGVATVPDFYVNTQDDGNFWTRTQFNRGGYTAAFSSIDPGASQAFDIPWYTSARIGAYQKIWHRLVYTLPTLKISRRLLPTGTTEIPLTYRGMYLECNWSSFQPVIEGVGGDYLEWNYYEGGTYKTLSDKNIVIKENQTITLKWYKVDAAGAKTLHDSLDYLVEGIPAKPTISVNKGTESTDGCPIKITISNQANFIGTSKLRIYLSGSSWQSKNTEFTAYHTGVYSVELLDSYDWFEDDGTSIIVDSDSFLVTNPTREILIDTEGHDCTLNASALSGSQCNPVKFVLDEDHKYDIPYVKTYAPQPITLTIEEKHENNFITMMFRAGTCFAVSSVATASTTNVTNYFKCVYYNGSKVATGANDCKNWLGALRTWKHSDIVQIELDTDAIALLNSFNGFFDSLCSGSTYLTYLSIPTIDVSLGTNFDNFFANVAKDTSLTELYLPTLDFSSAQSMSYAFGGMFVRTPISHVTIPPINCKNATNLSGLFRMNFFGCPNLKSVTLPYVDTTSCTNANELILLQTSDPATYGAGYLESITIPLYDLSNATINNLTNIQNITTINTINAPTIKETATKSWNNTTIVFKSNVTINHDGDYLSELNTATLSADAEHTLTYNPPFNTVSIICTVSAGTFRPINNIALNSSFFNHVVAIVYNGTRVAKNNTEAKTWLTEQHTFANNDEYRIVLNPNTLATETDLSVFMGVFGAGTAAGLHPELKTIVFPEMTFAATSAMWLFNAVCAHQTGLTSAIVGTIHLPYASNLGREIPDTIGMFSDAFLDCTSLTSVTFNTIDAPSATSGARMFDSTFQGCNNLTTVILPSIDTSGWTTATYFLVATFYGCTSLSNLTLPLYDLSACGNVSTCANNMFYNCVALHTVNMPTVNPTATKTIASSPIAFKSTLTINHSNNWLTLARTTNITTSTGETITYNPALS